MARLDLFSPYGSTGPIHTAQVGAAVHAGRDGHARDPRPVGELDAGDEPREHAADAEAEAEAARRLLPWRSGRTWRDG